MTDESRYTIDDAPEPPVPDEAPPSAPSRPNGAPEPSAPDAEVVSADGGGAGTKDAWRDVLTQIDALGDSISRWAKAAVNDPENRRHATEIRDKLDSAGAKIASTFDDATHTEIGRSVAEAADKTGKVIVDVSGKVAQEAAPAVVSVLSGLAGFLGKAADRVGQAAERPASAPESDAGSQEAPVEPVEGEANAPDAAVESQADDTAEE